jgi:hypothetical protein
MVPFLDAVDSRLSPDSGWWDRALPWLDRTRFSVLKPGDPNARPDDGREGDMFELIMIGGAAAGIGAGYVSARRFVRERLRFVDGVDRKSSAVGAGVVAAAAATPVAWLLPVLGAGSAVVFGIGVALGVSHGARDLRSGRYLAAGD